MKNMSGRSLNPSCCALVVGAALMAICAGGCGPEATDPCAALPAPCDDADPCTEDNCSQRDGFVICDHRPVVCDDGFCDPNDGQCVACLVELDCDDADACTMDACDDGVCV